MFVNMEGISKKSFVSAGGLYGKKSFGNQKDHH